MHSPYANPTHLLTRDNSRRLHFAHTHTHTHTMPRALTARPHDSLPPPTLPDPTRPTPDARRPTPCAHSCPRCRLPGLSRPPGPWRSAREPTSTAGRRTPVHSTCRRSVPRTSPPAPPHWPPCTLPLQPTRAPTLWPPGPLADSLPLLLLPCHLAARTPQGNAGPTHLAQPSPPQPTHAKHTPVHPSPAHPSPPR